MNEINQTNAQISAEPVQIQPPNPKKQVKKCYNWACGSMLCQLLFAYLIMIIISIGYSSVMTAKLMAEGNFTSQAELTNAVAESITPLFNVATTAISYLIANICSYFIANGATKSTFKAKIFGKIKTFVPDSLLCVLAILGLQGLSMIIQVVVTVITKTSGINSETAEMFSFSDDIVKNVVLVVYTIIIAAVTEELLCRGALMKLFSPVNKTFALVASSLMFGLMHGNFNQMFNGFMLGLVLGYAAMKSKSLKLSIICHMAANTNAILLSYFEYKIGDSFFNIELIYAAVLAVIGIVSVIVLLKRNGKINEAEDGFPCETAIEIPEGEEKSLKWKLLFKSPCFWIFTVIYVFIAITQLNPIA